MNYYQLDDDAVPQMQSTWFGATSLPDMALGFAGDPYPEPPTTRSVSLAVDLGDLGVTPGSCPWAGCGELYSKEVLGPDVDVGMFAGEFIYGSGYSDQLRPSMTPMELQEAAKSCALEVSQVEPFKQQDEPPRLPSDPLFELEKTALHVRSKEPFCVGNILLDFLRSEVIASDVKIKHHKFSIKAIWFCSSSTCCVKLRMYKAGEAGLFIVEAQRRKGDAVVFAEGFEMLSRYLQHEPRCHVVTLNSPLTQVAASWPPIVPPVSEEDVWPLIDMAAGGDAMPAQLRAELASAFARVAKDGQVAGVLCSGEACKAWMGLLSASEEDVLLPVAEALYELASRQDANHLFAQHGLMEAMHKTLLVNAAGSAARVQLARALQVVAARNKETLVQKFVAGEGYHDLAEAISDSISESDSRPQSSGDAPELYR